MSRKVLELEQIFEDSLVPGREKPLAEVVKAFVAEEKVSPMSGMTMLAKITGQKLAEISIHEKDLGYKIQALFMVTAVKAHGELWEKRRKEEQAERV
jgi:hypothetical protein